MDENTNCWISFRTRSSRMLVNPNSHMSHRLVSSTKSRNVIILSEVLSFPNRTKYQSDSSRLTYLTRMSSLVLENSRREARAPPQLETPLVQNDEVSIPKEMPRISASALIFSLSLTTAIPSFLNGAIVVCLPNIAAEIYLARSLLLW